MSFNNNNTPFDEGNQQQSWNNDSGNYRDTNRDTDTSWNDINFQGTPSGDQQQGFGSDLDAQRSAFSGNTTDTSVPGTGEFGGTGRNAGMQQDLRSDGFGRGENWDNENNMNPRGAAGAGQGIDNTWDDTSPRSDRQGGGGKPSMGDRLKGDMEKVAGKVMRNPSLVERGQERKEDQYDNTGNF